MNSIVFVSFIVFTVTALTGTDALTCNVGCAASKTPEDCPGSCVKVKIGKSIVLGCSPVHVQDGCKTLKGIEACFCNTDKCNNAQWNHLSGLLLYLGINLPSTDIIETERLE